jgi:putative nucleotidyltransferase with HDIG domain
VKTGKRTAAAPTGLPGEQQLARERKADLKRRISGGVLAVLGLGLLVVLVGPTRVPNELPPVGPAAHDLVALRAFVDEEPAPDLAAAQDRAVLAVPVHYTFESTAAKKRIDAIHDAFRLVRPRYRLYLADRERLVDDAKARKDTPPQGPDPVRQLDAAIDEELARLRPEFEAGLVARRAELNGEVFAAVRKAGFAEEVELLLSDTAQILLGQRIVRDLERFDDDVQRGVWEASTGQPYDRGSAAKLLDLDSAQKQAEEDVTEFMKQKKSSRFDEPSLQGALKALARGMVDVTFTRDLAATRTAEEQARGAVPKTRLVRFARGESLVKRGDMVTPLLQQRIARMLQGTDDDQTPRSYAGTAILLAVSVLLFSGFASRHLRHFRYRPRDGHLLAAILLVHALVLRLLFGVGNVVVEPGGSVSAAMWAVGLPYALGPTLATLFLKPFTAAPFSLVCTVVATLMAHNSTLLHGVAGLEGLVAVQSLCLGLAGVHAARHFRQRADLIWGAMTISGVGSLCGVAVALFTAPLAADLLDPQNLWIVGMGLASGISCYLLLSALTPVFETLFNRLTDIKLLELTSMNHPALRLLATEAPGTFTHSVMVGNLAQAGCDAIGANGLLARVGAYYHDLGKTRNPKYFAENQSGDNPHDKLKPHLSALIIRSHVKDGIKILKGFGLPDEIIDFVPQHHGTSLIAHFYHRAQREVESAEDLNEADFRYPGPKPQRRETALLMLADAVEAACKAMPEPNPMRVQGMVKKIIAGKMEDGQFEECDLTLRELALVEQAFVRVVIGMHHSRPVYLPPMQPQHQVAQQALPLLTPTTVPSIKLAPREPLEPAAHQTDQHARPRPGLEQEPARPEEAPQAPTAVVSARSQRRAAP